MFKLDRICAYCKYYTFVHRSEPGGAAYCKFYKKWFPEQQNPNNERPGVRTCDNWEQKIYGEERINENSKR
uniref:Uncharacterized protein n=1 Tax=viral metagenome TaxID=1070528 RepID=A0A6M3L7R1_9ZZZZ